MAQATEFKDSPIRDFTSADSITYTVDTDPYGGSPSNVAVTAKNLTTGATVTSSVLSGSAPVTADTITLPAIGSLIPNNTYRIDVQFDSGGNTFRRSLRIIVGNE